MPRPVTKELSRRRRERLAELFDALGAARGSRLTQRVFAASIGREQGTIAAILGGHRALGGDVMLAVVQAYGLPVDYFDAPTKPDPRPFARAVVGAVPDLVGGGRRSAPKPKAALPAAANGDGDPSLEEALEALRPDHAVSVALRAIERVGGERSTGDWLRLAVGAQSAHERGTLLEWYDRALAAPARRADRPGVLRPVGTSPGAKALERP